MKKLILTIAVALSSLTLVGQTIETQEPTVEFDIHRGLYKVYMDANNYHYVTEAGVITGPFKFTSNNIVIKGRMVNGKRHGTIVTMIDNKPSVIVEYDMGKPIAYTRILD